MSRHLRLGEHGEGVAVLYLKKLGYHILEQNKRYPLGEIDILARDGQTLVIVEVKTGRTGQFGYAYERVGSQKQHKLRQLARRLSQDYPNAALRIDLMNVDEHDRVLHWQSAVEA